MVFDVCLHIIIDFFSYYYCCMQKKSWKNFFSYLGPGFLVSIAYIDPGNCKIRSLFFKKIYHFIYYTHKAMQFCFFTLFVTVETDLQSGAQYKYEVR